MSRHWDDDGYYSARWESTSDDRRQALIDWMYLAGIGLAFLALSIYLNR